VGVDVGGWVKERRGGERGCGCLVGGDVQVSCDKTARNGQRASSCRDKVVATIVAALGATACCSNLLQQLVGPESLLLALNCCLVATTCCRWNNLLQHLLQQLVAANCRSTCRNNLSALNHSYWP
jgi:hypothetical protein